MKTLKDNCYSEDRIGVEILLYIWLDLVVKISKLD